MPHDLAPPTVRTDDARYVAQILLDARACSDAYEQRADSLLQALALRLGTKLAVFGMVRIVPGAGASEPLHARRVSSMSADELGALHAYYADMRAVPDPALVRCVEAMGRRPGPVCARREDLVSDEEWYASDNVLRCRKPGGVDAELLSGAPTSEPHTYAACSFHKAWGEPGFTERERDLVFLFQTSVGWVFEDLAREREGEAVVRSLPPRRGLALAALLAGDSEKQAARRLGVTVHTVHQHIKALHRALGVASRGELLARCFALHITPNKLEAAATTPGKIAFPVEKDPDLKKPPKAQGSRARGEGSGGGRQGRKR